MVKAEQKQSKVEKPRRSNKKSESQGSAVLSAKTNKARGEIKGQITKSLIDSSLKGHVQSARLLLELAVKQDEGKGKEKKRRPKSWAKILASEPEWDARLAKPEIEMGTGQRAQDG